MMASDLFSLVEFKNDGQYGTRSLIFCGLGGIFVSLGNGLGFGSLNLTLKILFETEGSLVLVSELWVLEIN